MKYIPKITHKILTPMEEEGVAAFLDDFAVSDDPETPITAGLFRLERGKKLTYTYTYNEMKIILEGEFNITDASGLEVIATPGDLLYFPKGSTITFSTPDYGLGFFCGQRGEGEA